MLTLGPVELLILIQVINDYFKISVFIIGTSIMLEAARVLAHVSKHTGWRPQRSIQFAHWDSEEFGLLGSTEYVEEMLKPLEHRAVALINVDNVNGNTTVAAKGKLSKFAYACYFQF